MQIRKMLALLAGSVGARLAGAGLGLITQIVIARTFSQDDVGIIFLTMSIASLLGLLVTAGYPYLALTELPRLAVHGRHKAAEMLHRLAMTDWLFLSVLVVAALAAALALFDLPSGLQTALIFGALAMPFAALIRFSSFVANAHKRYGATLIPDSIVRPGLFLAVIGSSLFMRSALSLWHVLLAFVACAALTAILQLPFVWGLFPDLRNLPKPRRPFAAVFRKRSFAIMIVAAVATMFSDIITLLGGLFLPPESVGILGVTIRLAAIAGFFIQSTQQLVLPDLSAAKASRNFEVSHSLLMQLNVITLAVAIAAFVGVVVIGKQVLQVFGASYAQGHSLLIMLMLAQAIRAFSGMNQLVLVIAGHHVRTVWACLGALAVLAVLWVVLVKAWGLQGVGFAVVGAELSWCLLLAAQAQVLTGARADLLWLLTRGPQNQA